MRLPLTAGVACLCLVDATVITNPPITASLTKRASIARNKKCDLGDNVQYFGSANGPGPFCASRFEAGKPLNPISKIISYRNGGTIFGLRVSYADSMENPQDIGHGFQESPENQNFVDFRPGEVVTGIRVYQNSITKGLSKTQVKGGLIGKIVFTTSTPGGTPREQFLGYSDIGDAEPDNIKYGSGILIGLSGSSDEKIDGIGFHFLGDGRVENVRIDNVKPLKDLSTLKPDVEMLDRSYFDNTKSDSTMHVGFGKKYTESTLQSFSQESTSRFFFGYKTEISASLLKIVEAKASYSFEYEKTDKTSSSLETGNSTTTTWHYNTDIGPGKAKICEAKFAKGKADIPYENSVTLEMKGGSTYTYKERGTQKAVLTSTVKTSCRDWDGKEVPEGYKDGSKMDGVTTLPAPSEKQNKPQANQDEAALLGNKEDAELGSSSTGATDKTAPRKPATPGNGKPAQPQKPIKVQPQPGPPGQPAQPANGPPAKPPSHKPALSKPVGGKPLRKRRAARSRVAKAKRAARALRADL